MCMHVVYVIKMVFVLLGFMYAPVAVPISTLHPISTHRQCHVKQHANMATGGGTCRATGHRQHLLCWLQRVCFTARQKQSPCSCWCGSPSMCIHVCDVVQEEPCVPVSDCLIALYVLGSCAPQSFGLGCWVCTASNNALHALCR